MNKINKHTKFMNESKRTNRSHSQYQILTQSYINSSNNNKQPYNIKHNNNSNNYCQQSIQQIIDTIKLYIKSANDLITYLNIPKDSHQQQQQQKNNQSKHSHIKSLITTTRNTPTLSTKTNINKQSPQLTLIIIKIQMFISLTTTQLTNINKKVQSSSLNQLKNITTNYHHILTYIKLKYSQLLKQTYRMLNIQTLFINQHSLLTQSDLLIVKENKKRKLKEIKQVEKQLQDLWNDNNKNTRTKQQNRINTLNRTKNNQQPQNQSSSTPLLINFTTKTSHNPRNLQMLTTTNNIQDIDLRQLAKQQLQKQFLSIRIQAYTMYEQYIQHQHSQFKERLKFAQQQQDILQTQLDEEIELSEQIGLQYHRVKRELQQIKTINSLIKKRYVLRESINIDSADSYMS